MLSSLVPLLIDPNGPIRKILVLVRTKTQIFRILDEINHLRRNLKDKWYKIQRSANFDVRRATKEALVAIPLVGRKDLCSYSGRSQMSIDCKSCSKKTKVPPHISSVIADELCIEEPNTTAEICALFQQNNILSNYCPYYSMRRMLGRASIVVTTHSWLYRGHLRKIIFAEVVREKESTAVVVDEAHGISPNDTAILPLKSINNILNYPMLTNTPTSVLLRYFFARTRKKAYGSYDKYHGKKILKAVNYELKATTELPEELKTDLRNVQQFFGSVGEYWIREKENDYDIDLAYVRLAPFPSTILEEFYDCARIVFMSGTVFLYSSYQLLFDLPKSFVYRSIPRLRPNQLKVILNQPGLTTAHKHRTPDRLLLYSLLCRVFHENNPGHTFVFCPSRRYSHDLHFMLTLNLKPDPSYRIYLEEGSVYNQSLIRTLEEEDHQLVLATLGGSFSEGIEVRDPQTGKSKITLILVLGIPHPAPTLRNQLLKSLYIIQYGKKVSHVLLERLPALQKVFQTLGRASRSENDKTMIVFLDQRYTQYNAFKDARRVRNYEIIAQGIKDFLGTY